MRKKLLPIILILAVVFASSLLVAAMDFEGTCTQDSITIMDECYPINKELNYSPCESDEDDPYLYYFHRGALFYEDRYDTRVWWHEYPTDEMRELVDSAVRVAQGFREQGAFTDSFVTCEPLGLCALCPWSSITIGSWTDWLRDCTTNCRGHSHSLMRCTVCNAHWTLHHGLQTYPHNWRVLALPVKQCQRCGMIVS